MNIDPKMRYKAETGNSAFIVIEAERLTKEFDSVQMQGMTSREIRDLIDYDCQHNVGLGIFLSQLPPELSEDESITIHSPEYIQWLESQIENKPS